MCMYAMMMAELLICFIVIRMGTTRVECCHRLYSSTATACTIVLITLARVRPQTTHTESYSIEP